MTTGRLTLETPSGPATAELVAGHAYARQAGVEHDVINDNPHEFVFVEIEAKWGDCSLRSRCEGDYSLRSW